MSGYSLLFSPSVKNTFELKQLQSLAFCNTVLKNLTCTAPPFYDFRLHVAVYELRHHRVHRVLRHPPRDGRAHLQDPEPDAR